MSWSRILGTATLMAFVLSLTVGAAESAVPNATNKKFYACMNKKTRIIKMLNYPKVKKCPKRHKRISWNAKGNPGLPGAAGPAGPAGPADWNAIPNKPAGFADGVDNVGSAGYVTETVSCANPISGPEYVMFSNLPRNMVHDFQVVPTNSADFLYIQRQEITQEPDGELRVDVLINGLLGVAGTCNIRRISFSSGISLANAKKQLKKVEVSYAKKGKKKRR